MNLKGWYMEHFELPNAYYPHDLKLELTDPTVYSVFYCKFFLAVHAQNKSTKGRRQILGVCQGGVTGMHVTIITGTQIEP
jgi:hypothetical protein